MYISIHKRQLLKTFQTTANHWLHRLPVQDLVLQLFTINYQLYCAVLKMKLTKELTGEIQIFISAVLFGFAFVGSRHATNDPAGPFTFNAWRFAVSAIVLIILRIPLKKCLNSDINSGGMITEREEYSFIVNIRKLFPNISDSTFHMFFWGMLCGTSNFAMSTFLQFGLQTVPVGKAAFINGLFVVVTPFIELCLPGAKYNITTKLWFSVFLSVAGTYLLSDAESATIGIGEVFVMFSTVSSACNILFADAGSKRADCIDLTCVEFITTFILSTIPSLYWESHMWVWPLPAFQQGWKMIVFVAITEGAAFQISTIGQMYATSNARSALIFSLESVFTAIFGYIILNETLTPIEIFGCVLMFSATAISSESLDQDPFTPLEEEDAVSDRLVIHRGEGQSLLSLVKGTSIATVSNLSLSEETDIEVAHIPGRTTAAIKQTATTGPLQSISQQQKQQQLGYGAIPSGKK